MMQTPSGYIATEPINGLAPGSYVIVHSEGTVGVNSGDGNAIWNHGSLEFTQWTGRYPTVRTGYETPSTPIVWIGFEPLDPYFGYREHPFSVGDLNGDGIDDVAVAHFFYPITSIDGYNGGNGARNGGTFVTVLDGRTGALLWSYMYPGLVNNLAIENGMLIVADTTGNTQSFLGQDGSVSNLDAWTFTNSGGALTATHAWTVSTGAQWAPWLALEKLPNGKIAAAWTNSPVGSGNATNGNELVVSLATGATDWSVATTGYPRFLRFDSSRNQVVAIEEADPSVTYSYSVVARNLLNGSLGTTVTEDSATALAFQVGDLDGDGLNEWVTSDLGYLPCTPEACLGIQNSGRVLAINGTTGATEWSQVRSVNPINPNDPLNGSPSPRPYGLLLTPTANGADVLVGSFMGSGNIELERLNGALNLSGPGGTVLWSKTSANAFLPHFMSLYQQGGATFVRAASSRERLYGISQSIDEAGTEIFNNGRLPFQVVRTFDVSNGNQVSATPLLGRIYAVAGTDVNRDGVTDLVVGGESGAVFALDGNKIDNQPNILWRRTVAGPIHQIRAADLDGDGRDEIVVAATSAIDVLDAASGNLRYELPYSPDYIWNFILADLNGDGKLDIVVPGASSLTAYSGPTGSILWTYTPSGSEAVGTLFSNVAITPDNIVTAQFAFGTQNTTGRTGSGFTRALVGINGASGAVLWSDSEASSSPLDTTKSSFPQFWHGTVAGQLDGIIGSVAGYSWVSYDSALDAFTPEMEIRDALTGSIINSLPPPSAYNGSLGTFLIPEKGVLSFGGNASWLLTSTTSGKALGYDAPYDMVEGNFGALGKRIIEGQYAAAIYVFLQSGIDFASWDAPIPHAAEFNEGVGVIRLTLQDLDHDGVDEIIRVPLDIDGNTALVQNIQGFGYEQTTFSDGLDILEVQPVPVQLSSVVSRKIHGSVGLFDIDLTNGGIECRSGGTEGDYTLVFTFTNALSSVAKASIVSGIGSVAGTSIDPNDPHNYIVNLAGVTNAQVVTVSLSNVTDSAGDFSGAISASMTVLTGDTNGDGVVNSADIGQTKAQSGQSVTNSNFREDLNVDGVINSADIGLVKSKSGTALP